MLVNVTPSSGLLQPISRWLPWVPGVEPNWGWWAPSAACWRETREGLRATLVSSKFSRSMIYGLEFFFPSLLGMTSFQVGGFPLYLQNYTGGINRRVPRHAESGPDHSWKQQRSQKKNLLYCMAWTTRSLHLCECLFYLGNHEPQNCLKGASPPSYLGKTWKNSKSIFSPNPTMERNLPHAETPCNQAVRPEPQLHYHFLSGVCAAWRMVNRAVKPWCQAAGAC